MNMFEIGITTDVKFGEFLTLTPMGFGYDSKKFKTVKFFRSKEKKERFFTHPKIVMDTRSWRVFLTCDKEKCNRDTQCDICDVIIKEYKNELIELIKRLSTEKWKPNPKLPISEEIEIDTLKAEEQREIEIDALKEKIANTLLDKDVK